LLAHHGVNGASRAAGTPQASGHIGDMPGKNSFSRNSNSADSYTTDKHVFKPPKDGETISPDRAERWQNASMQSLQTKSSSAGATSQPASPTTMKSAKKQPQVRLPEPEIVPPVAAPMADDGLNLKKVKPPGELLDDWYPGYPLNPEAGRHGPYDIPGVRPGMSHPPQNPKVRKQLLAYLYARQVPHTVERRTIKSPKRSQKSDSLSSSTLEASQDERQTPKAGSMQASGPPHGSAGFTSLQGPSKSASMPNLEGRARNKTTQAAGSSGNRMESLQQDGRKARPPPSLGEDEVRRKAGDLRLHSRYHGFEIANAGAKELSQLSIYHNEVTRRHFPNHVKQQEKGATPGQKLRELRSFFLDQADRQDDGRSTDWDDHWSLGASETKLVRPLYYEDYGPLGVGPSPGQASPTRIKKLAEQMEPVLDRFCSSGTRAREGRPNRLQAMSRATGMNVITGALRQEPLC